MEELEAARVDLTDDLLHERLDEVLLTAAAPAGAMGSGAAPPARGAVVAALGELFPLALAESWDNVGLLVRPGCAGCGAWQGEACCAWSRSGSETARRRRVLLSNDLTEPVLKEAEAMEVGLIITYHPRPFSGLKRLTPDNVTQRIVLRCVQKDIWVYSPHTACDNAASGVNDWLAAAVTAAAQDYAAVAAAAGTAAPAAAAAAGHAPIAVARTATVDLSDDLMHGRVDEDAMKEALFQVQPVGKIEGAGAGAGRGRSITLRDPVPLSVVVARLKQHLGVPTLRVALADKVRDEALEHVIIGSAAVQAGSGISVLRSTKVDLWVSGEMGHHDVLEANASGTTVILAEHSNSERGFLHAFLGRELSSRVPGIKVYASNADRDPLRTV
jgi:dinuclear metal center YbgI/SA1388 family protein